MHFWGFASHPTLNSDYQFTQYSDQTEAELNNYGQFDVLNKKVIADCAKAGEVWKVDQGPVSVQIADLKRILGSLNEEFVVKNP